MPFTYTPNTPQAPNFPANDQPLMNSNNRYLQEFGTRDHQFTLTGAVNNLDGTHKQVTLTNQAAPGFTGASSAIYANTANAQSQLFFQNALGSVQLTTQKAGVPTVAANGSTFLPGTSALGGLVIQWGTGTAGVPVVFPIAFTNAVFSPRVTVTPFGATGSCTTPPVISTGPSTTGFTATNNGGQAFTFHWMAIGQA